jgi:hypothetical protein
MDDTPNTAPNQMWAIGKAAQVLDVSTAKLSHGGWRHLSSVVRTATRES